MKYFLSIIIILLSVNAWAEVPAGYTTVFSSGFNTGVSITCPDSGDGCSECEDKSTRYLTGTDSVTGYAWSDLNFTGAFSTILFNDLATDCVTDLDACHTIEIIASGIAQYGGGTGASLKGVLVADCNSTSYSRIQLNIWDAAEGSATTMLESLKEYYAEIDIIIANPEVITNGKWLSLVENYDIGYDWKSTLLLECSGDDCTAEPAGPKFYMKNYLVSGGFSKHQDNLITPEAGKPFRLRVWYKGDVTDGWWKATYECPTCTMSDETIIKEFTGQTTDVDDANAIALIKAASMWDNLEIYWTSLTVATPGNILGVSF